MEAPFVYGRIADDLNFTDRKNEVALLTQNFKNLINTVIISPRRWGKTSLVNKCAKLLSEENKNTLVCQVDIFNCRTEEQFYTAYANALMRVSTSAWEEFVAGVKKYLSRMAPTVSLSEGSQSYELSFGIGFKDNRLSYDEILDLPQQIAKDKVKRSLSALMNSKISTNMKIRLLFNVNFVLIGRHIHLFAIACMGVNVICY